MKRRNTELLDESKLCISDDVMYMVENLLPIVRDNETGFLGYMFEIKPNIICFLDESRTITLYKITITGKLIEMDNKQLNRVYLDLIKEGMLVYNPPFKDTLRMFNFTINEDDILDITNL